MAGELVYFLVPTADAERAKAFYGALFGWEFREFNIWAPKPDEGG